LKKVFNDFIQIITLIIGKDHLMNGVITLMDEYDDKLGGFGGG